MAEGDVPGLVLVVQPVDLADGRVQSVVGGEVDVVVVDDLLEDKDPGEYQEVFDVRVLWGVGQSDRLVGVDLGRVLEAERGEEPHVVIFLADEVVEELRGSSKPGVWMRRVTSMRSSRMPCTLRL